MIDRRYFFTRKGWRWVLYLHFPRKSLKLTEGTADSKEQAQISARAAYRRFWKLVRKLDNKKDRYIYLILYRDDGIKKYKKFTVANIVECMEFMDNMDGELFMVENC